MALKYTVDDLTSVPAHLRSEYEKGNDGKYHLALDGHPDTPRLAEFRKNNIERTRERDVLAAKLAAFDGIDPDAAKAALAKIAAGEDADVVKLKLDLAESQSATAAAIEKANALVHRQAVSAAFLAAGGRPEAVDFIVGKAPFTVVDGELKAKEGEPSPTITEWLLDQAGGPNAFAFHPNKGGGAEGGKPAALALGVRANVRILRNPTAAELGANANDIAAGRAKVEYTT